LSIVPPNCGCGWQTTATPRGSPAGESIAHSIAPAGPVTVVAQAPSDPFFAQSLQGWEQGRFIRFYGVARWVGWRWADAAIV
jgi:hypothetical protein